MRILIYPKYTLRFSFFKTITIISVTIYEFQKSLKQVFFAIKWVWHITCLQTYFIRELLAFFFSSPCSFFQRLHVSFANVFPPVSLSWHYLLNSRPYLKMFVMEPPYFYIKLLKARSSCSAVDWFFRNSSESIYGIYPRIMKVVVISVPLQGRDILQKMLQISLCVLPKYGFRRFWPQLFV